VRAITLDDTIRIRKKVVFQKVGDEMVLLNMESGIYFGLNPTGARLWELLAEKKELNSILDIMAKEYAVERAQLEKDILKLLRKMASKKLVEVAKR
jgi:hypothetical protein